MDNNNFNSFNNEVPNTTGTSNTNEALNTNGTSSVNETSNTYGSSASTVNEASNTYSSSASTVNQVHSYSNPYQAQSNYGTQNPYVQPVSYGQQSANGQQSMYGQQTTNGQQTTYGQQNVNGQKTKESSAKPPKKKGGMGALIGKAAVAAIVFALIGAPIFTGISYGMNKLVGVTNSSSNNNSSTTKKSDSQQIMDQDQTVSADPIATTDTSAVATDLTDVSAIVKEVMPSIVAITNTGTTTYDSYWGTQSYESTSCGSGIIIAQDDNYIYIVTNNHVVENSNSLKVQFSDESTVEAEIKGTDASDDLAVVRVARSNIDADTLNTIRVASVADSTQLQVGSASIAIGNALGYGQSVTTGVISALNRSVTVEDNGNTIIHNNLIQTDAAINPGNSGGALLNAQGQVIGINSVKYTDTDVEGIGYAIPITDAMKIVTRLIEREVVDEADASYLGIKGRDITSSMASAYNWPVGVYVVEAISGEAAAEGGIQNYDIITAIGEVTVTSMTDLKTELSYYKAGETVTFTIQRMNGDTFDEITLDVTLGSAKTASSNSGSGSSSGSGSGRR